MTFRLTRNARADIDEIWDFTVDNWGENQAEAYLVELGNTFSRAVEFPSAGQDRSTMIEGMRSLKSGRHVVFYRVVKAEVVILRVVHQRRDMSGLKM